MRLDQLVGAAFLVLHLLMLTVRRPPRLTLEDRLAMLPRMGLPITGSVIVHWDKHQIPFITAENDDDLAVVLGIVHAHLRLGQLEMLRRPSQGRVAESIGPLGFEIDRLIRTIDLGRAVPEIARALPEETRRWLQCFVRGLNHYIVHATTLPEEFRLLAFRREPWSITDILRLGRLVSADVNWIVWFRLLRLRDDPDWLTLWRRLTHHDVLSPDSTQLADAPTTVLKSGSNCFVVSPQKCAKRAPLIASDPHLAITLPNPWIIAGMSSPSYHAVGLMIPGLPFVAAGRNTTIAWGGTNLHAASSDLVVVPSDAQTHIREREETIAVRWRHRRKIRVREGRWGPIVTDIPWLRSKDDVLALRWIGHQPSDETTAMLRANRARNWAEFRKAFDGFAIPGQRMLYADCDGHIGQLMAARLPRRHRLPALDLATDAEEPGDWAATIGSADLPWTFDPPHGFIASANERPSATDPLIGHHFSPGDRKQRLDQLLSSETSVSVDAASRIQRDVISMTALRQRDLVLSWLNDISIRTRTRDERLILELRNWDGAYGEGSHGALAFELLFFHLARRLVGARRREAYEASWGARALIWEDVRTAPSSDRSRALEPALRDAANAMAYSAVWGTFHRVRPGHPLSLMPVIGHIYRTADLPAAGSSETVFKTAHPLTDKRHTVSYGTSARHISDLADPNRNYFVLLGGQDGWLGSTTFADQIPLWRQGEYIVVPLAPEAVADTFPYRTELTP